MVLQKEKKSGQEAEGREGASDGLLQLRGGPPGSLRGEPTLIGLPRPGGLSSLGYPGSGSSLHRHPLRQGWDTSCDPTRRSCKAEATRGGGKGGVQESELQRFWPRAVKASSTHRWLQLKGAGGYCRDGLTQLSSGALASVLCCWRAVRTLY